VVYRPARHDDDLRWRRHLLLAAFNWGCIDLADVTVTDSASIPAEIELHLETAGVRDVVVQELSCPAGYADAPSTVGGSP